MRRDPRVASHLRVWCLFSCLAEGGRACDAAAAQGAEDVHDPDHRPVQVCLPSARPVPPKLQTHLTPRPSSCKRTQLRHADGEAPQTASPPEGRGWPEQAGHGLLRTGAESIHKTS